MIRETTKILWRRIVEASAPAGARLLMLRGISTDGEAQCVYYWRRRRDLKIFRTGSSWASAIPPTRAAAEEQHDQRTRGSRRARRFVEESSSFSLSCVFLLFSSSTFRVFRLFAAGSYSSYSHSPFRCVYFVDVVENGDRAEGYAVTGSQGPFVEVYFV